VGSTRCTSGTCCLPSGTRNHCAGVDTGAAARSTRVRADDLIAVHWE
jgi:hypothetical protein